MKNKMFYSFILFSFSLLFFLMFSMYIYNSKTLIYEVNIIGILTDFSFSLIFDNISLMFGIIVTIISTCVFMFACKYMEEDKTFFRFIWILLSFVISMLILIFSSSLFFMLLGWDGLGITSFALIIYYQSKESYDAGFLTMMINRLGDALIVSSFVLFLIYGHFLISQKLFFLTVVFLVVASLTKSAQFPFSAWLPAAMAAPTPVSALVHSSTLVTAGIYLIIRLSVFSLDEFSSKLLILLGSVTCFLGGAAAMYEYDLKKIIALSTLSQLGLMMFCLGMGYYNLSLFHLFTHALFKAMLFLSAGSILMMAWGNQDMRLLGGISRVLPVSIMIFSLSSLCLMGIPFLSAFFSKHSILEMMMMSKMNFFSLMIMLLSTVFSTVYSVRMLKVLCWSIPVNSLNLKNNSLKVNVSMMILGFFSVVFGKILFFSESFYLEYMNITAWMNMIIVFGVLYGLTMKLKNSYFFSSMFYSVPLLRSVNNLLNPIMKKLVMLDFWMEFGPLMNLSVDKFNNFNVSAFNWPKNSIFARVFMLMLILNVISFM
uniref:NADH dehydrogenase subunit 5 n=1 Tax=Ferrissia californica TaxID=1776375 RepID=UPI00315DCECA